MLYWKHLDCKYLQFVQYHYPIKVTLIGLGTNKIQCNPVARVSPENSSDRFAPQLCIFLVRWNTRALYYKTFTAAFYRFS